jgi:DNA repair protein RadC
MEQIHQTNPLYLLAEVELIYRSKVRASDRPKITDSKSTFDLLISHWDMDKIELFEEFKVLFLNQSNRVLGIYNVSSGGITGTVADPRLIFGAALKATACNLILAHSHPSGNLRPSQADELLTAKFKEAGKFLDIRVIDHIIVTKDQYFSFADEGLL